MLITTGMLVLSACGNDEARDGDTYLAKAQPGLKLGPERIKTPYSVPYKAIEPVKGTKKLVSNYSEEEKKEMPSYEARGGEKSRSVPLGQTLLKGKQDLSNGPLKNNRLVAYYGTPLSENMGILGEQSPEETMRKLKEQAAVYSKLDPERPAIPTIELIATVAQRSPGPGGLYITPPSKKVIDEYVQLAKKHDVLLMLDVQLGRADVMQAVKEVDEYLKLPNVHLAIDTEYSVGPGQVPGEDLGHVEGADIQKAVEYVDDLVKRNNLPDKVVLVHQFAGGIVRNKNEIHPTKHVQVPLNYDGFGDAAVKQSVYGQLVKNEPIQYGGFKLFHKNDVPLMTPKQVLQLDPAPAIVNYQ